MNSMWKTDAEYGLEGSGIPSKIKNIQKHEDFLLNYATNQIRKFNNINIVGQAEKKTSVISFLIDDTHPFDVGTLLDQMGIAIRTGHHCTQPLMDFYEIPGTARVSLAFYNTKEEIDYFMESLKRVIRLLS